MAELSRRQVLKAAALGAAAAALAPLARLPLVGEPLAQPVARLAAAAHPGRLTIPAGLAGKYLLSASVWPGVRPDGLDTVVLTVNGRTKVAEAVAVPIEGARMMRADAIVDLTAGDYVEVTGSGRMMAVRLDGGAYDPTTSAQVVDV